MAVARPATDRDRLPWLDSRVHRRKRDPRPLLIALFGIAAFGTVAGLSFWFGQQSLEQAGADGWPADEEVDHVVTQELPRAVIEPPAEEAPAAPKPEPEPEPEAVAEPRPSVQPARPAPQRSERTEPKRETPKPSAKERPAAKEPARAKAAAPVRRVVRQRYSGYWPTPATAVRLGRVIQIGTFSTERRADDAWRKTLRRYPQTRGLPRISSAYKASNGRIYHRLQIMTTAPAQSQWLCRRMRADGRRCTVLGSPA